MQEGLATSKAGSWDGCPSVSAGQPHKTTGVDFSMLHCRNLRPAQGSGQFVPAPQDPADRLCREAARGKESHLAHALGSRLGGGRKLSRMNHEGSLELCFTQVCAD